jgi:hypothetical protein
LLALRHERYPDPHLTRRARQASPANQCEKSAPAFPEAFFVIPAQAGIQGFQSLALGPRFRGDDDFGRTAGFPHSLKRSYRGAPRSFNASAVSDTPLGAARSADAGRPAPQKAKFRGRVAPFDWEYFIEFRGAVRCGCFSLSYGARRRRDRAAAYGLLAGIPVIPD